MATAQDCALVGLEGALVEVEVDITDGLPEFTIVGLPDARVNEAKERVRAAMMSGGWNHTSAILIFVRASTKLLIPSMCQWFGGKNMSNAYWRWRPAAGIMS